jgi:hypothetical protein
LWLADSLIPPCGRAVGAAYLPFYVLRALCARAEAAFFGLASLPSLFAFVGVRLPWRKHRSFRPPHAREGAQRDAFTSVKQLRPTSLPARISHAYLAHLVRKWIEIGTGWRYR